MPLLVTWIGTANLLLLAAISLAGAGWALRRIVQIAPVLNTNETGAAQSAPADDMPQPRLFADPYIRLMMITLLLFGLSDNLIDNLFYAQAGVRFSDPNQLAGFLGAFTALVGGINLLSQLFLASAVLRRFGVHAIIMLTPVILLATILPFVLVEAVDQWSPLLFGLTVAINLARRQ